MPHFCQTATWKYQNNPKCGSQRLFWYFQVAHWLKWTIFIVLWPEWTILLLFEQFDPFKIVNWSEWYLTKKIMSSTDGPLVEEMCVQTAWYWWLLHCAFMGQDRTNYLVFICGLSSYKRFRAHLIGRNWNDGNRNEMEKR